jgi:hypothetical protein
MSDDAHLEIRAALRNYDDALGSVRRAIGTSYDDEGAALTLARLVAIVRAMRTLSEAQQQCERAIEAAGFTLIEV